MGIDAGSGMVLNPGFAAILRPVPNRTGITLHNTLTTKNAELETARLQLQLGGSLRREPHDWDTLLVFDFFKVRIHDVVFLLLRLGPARRTA